MSVFVEERTTGARTVLFLHGLGASRDHLYATADALAGRFRCLLPDLRGHGDSPGGADGSMDGYASDLVELARSESPLAVVGLSLGGLVGVALWHAVPETVSSVVLVDPLCDPEPLWRWAGQGGRRGEERYRRLISPYLERDENALVRLMADFPLTEDLGESARRRNARSHLRADRVSIDATLEVMKTNSRPVLLRRPAGASAGVTLIKARRSPVSPMPSAQDLAGRLDGRVVEVDSTHCVSLADPDVLAEALASVLAGDQTFDAAQRTRSPVHNSA
jgi:pimeloyl-ACP methyl ester carboxylesterase